MKLDDDWFAKVVKVKDALTLIPQHSHESSHATVLMTGTMRIWADEELLGDFHAPTVVLIKARSKHRMLTLTEDVTFACVHALNGAGEVRIFEDHIFAFEEN